MRFLTRRPDTEVVTIGHFDPGSPLGSLPRVKALPYLAYSEYMRVLGTASASLVPLVACDFNACKSVVRLIDATAAGVPVIASPVGEYADPNLESTYLPAQTPSDWCDALETLASSPSRAAALIAAARRDLLGARRLDRLHEALDRDLRGFLDGFPERVERGADH